MAKICGIDEAGRGALAGPLSVAACVLNKEISGLNDSKKAQIFSSSTSQMRK